MERDSQRSSAAVQLDDGDLDARILIPGPDADESNEEVLKAKQSKRSKSPSAYRKPCDLCNHPNDVLVRCRIDETQKWHFVCTAKCWNQVSGGVVDGPDKPYYTYGGMWKNKHAGVSASKPKNRKKSDLKDWTNSGTKYVKNDKVRHDGTVWACRRSHVTSDMTQPGQGYTLWKEDANTGRKMTPEKAEPSPAVESSATATT